MLRKVRGRFGDKVSLARFGISGANTDLRS